MPNAVPLNNVDHKDLRVSTKRGIEYGDNIMFANTFPSEFLSIQTHYPIIFRRTPDGLTFEALALLGLQDDENLFLGPDGWDASYVPLMIQRQPFLIGVAGEELTVNVYLDSPSISSKPDEGEALFLTHGGPTPFLERVNSMLFAIHDGLSGMPAFISALMEHGLLESFAFEFQMDDGSRHRIEGFYTIMEEKLNALNGVALEALHRAGYLQAIYMAIASMGNLRKLIDRKNRLHAERD